MKCYAYAVLALLTAALVAPAAPVEGDEAAREAAEVCLKAIRDRDWKALARQTHPESLEAFKAALTPALKRAAAGSDGKDASRDLQVSTTLAVLGDADPKKLLAMAPEEFLAAFAEATLAGAQRGLFGGMEARVVGVVRDGDDVVHVLYRAKGPVRFAEGRDDRGGGRVRELESVGEVTRMGVLTVRRSGKGWKANVPDELQHVSALLRGEWKERKPPAPDR
jgi:hypothetical protein